MQKTRSALAVGISTLLLGSASLGVPFDSASASALDNPSLDRTDVATSEAQDFDSLEEVEIEWNVEESRAVSDTDSFAGQVDTDDAESHSPESQEDVDASHAISPLAVPNPTSSTAVITVKVGGDRAANGVVQPLQGVRLALHGAGTATGGGGSSGAGQVPVQGAPGLRYNAAWSWTTCESDVEGDCSFVVPVRPGAISSTGVPQDTRFWVAQDGTVPGSVAAANYYSNSSLRIGNFGASPERAWQYRFRTDVQLRAGTAYSSTTAMPWNTTAGDPDRYFMRNRIDTNTEDWYAANVGRTTGMWNQSRNNPDIIGGCPIDIALITDTSGSLRANNDLPKLQNAMSSFADAFRGTNARMAVFSFSNLSPGSGSSNHPTLMPVTTSTQASAFKAQYANWADGGGTNWDSAFAAVANATPHYDLAILLTDGNPTVIRNNPGPGSSAYNSFQDVDAGIFSANQLKAQGTRVIALGIGGALTSASENNLRAVSGPNKNSDYFRVDDFDEAKQMLVELAKERCTGSIGVQKLIVPEGGTIADASPAPAGWEFNATVPSSGVSIVDPSSQTTTAESNGKVDYGLAYDTGTTSADVQIHETQQDGFEHVPVDGKNAVCTNVNTGANVSVTNAGDEALPGFRVNTRENERVECKIYNTPASAGELEYTKSSDPASGSKVTPGQEITYTLTFENTGSGPVEVNHEDLLTDVFDDADLQGTVTAEAPLTAILSTTGGKIHVTGILPANTIKTVTYTVKVKDPLPDSSNSVLRNYLIPEGEEPPEECEPHEPCTEHPITAGVSWNKVDGAEPGNLLEGSEWTLIPYGENDELDEAGRIIVTDCVAESAAQCEGPDTDPEAGKFFLDGLTPGQYRLTETRAPAGYKLLADPMDVLVNGNNVQMGDIVNEQMEVPSLPLTGGIGTTTWIISALILGAIAASGTLLQRTREKSEA